MTNPHPLDGRANMRTRFGSRPPMTAAMLSIPIGSEGMLRCGDMYVRVRILDARCVFNRVDLLVTPIAGDGTQWVAADRVKMEG